MNIMERIKDRGFYGYITDITVMSFIHKKLRVKINENDYFKIANKTKQISLKELIKRKMIEEETQGMFDVDMMVLTRVDITSTSDNKGLVLLHYETELGTDIFSGNIVNNGFNTILTSSHTTMPEDIASARLTSRLETDYSELTPARFYIPEGPIGDRGPEGVLGNVTNFNEYISFNEYTGAIGAIGDRGPNTIN